MDAEDRIDMLKKIPPLSEFEKKRKQRTIIILVISTVMSVAILVYAFQQKRQAEELMIQLERARTTNEFLDKQLDEQRKLAEQNAAEARRIAEECESMRKK